LRYFISQLIKKSLYLLDANVNTNFFDKISDKIRDDSLKELFSLIFKIFEDQENFKVQSKTKYVPNAAILAKLKSLGNLNDSTPYSYVYKKNSTKNPSKGGSD
jgi:hypothetical protein